MSLRQAPRHLQGLPTLTEVIELAAPADPAQAAAAPAAAPAQTTAPPIQEMPPAPRRDEAEIVTRVLVELQRQVEPMLEQHLREALEPALLSVSQSVVREVHAALAATLREMAAREVGKELARRRLP